MFQGDLGTPFKYCYYSRNGVGGLTDIVARVRRPDGTIDGPFALTEESDSFFGSVYCFTYNNALAFGEGEYLVGIQEPTANHFSYNTLRLTTNSGGGSGTDEIDATLTAVLKQSTLNATLKASANITAQIKTSKLVATYSATKANATIQASAKLNATAKINKLTAIIEECS